jgi:hypothetical protein
MRENTSDEQWTTRLEPEMTREYGVDQIHMIWFAPKGWQGKGPTVGLGIPECELICTKLDRNGDPLSLVNRPRRNKNLKRWLRTACKMAIEQGAAFFLSCDTAEQASAAAKQAAKLLPDYQRVALERMYAPESRSRLNLS